SVAWPFASRGAPPPSPVWSLTRSTRPSVTGAPPKVIVTVASPCGFTGPVSPPQPVRNPPSTSPLRTTVQSGHVIREPRIIVSYFRKRRAKNRGGNDNGVAHALLRREPRGGNPLPTCDMQRPHRPSIFPNHLPVIAHAERLQQVNVRRVRDEPHGAVGEQTVNAAVMERVQHGIGGVMAGGRTRRGRTRESVRVRGITNRGRAGRVPETGSRRRI